MDTKVIKLRSVRGLRDHLKRCGVAWIERRVARVCYGKNLSKQVSMETYIEIDPRYADDVAQYPQYRTHKTDTRQASRLPQPNTNWRNPPWWKEGI